MRKLFIALAIISASFAAQAKMETTVDGQFSVMTSANQVVVRAGDKAPMICHLVIEKKMVDDFGKSFTTPFYKCNETMAVSFKRPDQRGYDSTMFIWVGNSLAYAERVK